MKLFVYEHITSGALADQELPPSLTHEGDSMLAAILQDLAEQPQVELVILRDSRLAKISFALDTVCEHLWVSNMDQFDSLWEQASRLADNTLVISPETDNQLIQDQQRILDKNKTYLGSSQAATALTTNKYHCYQHLLAHDIATPNTQIASQWHAGSIDNCDGLIIKPIDGAGCLDTNLFQNMADASKHINGMTTSSLSSHIVQPYIKGIAASLSLFISDNSVTVLSINRQQFQQQDTQLILQSTEVNAISENELSPARAQQLAENVSSAISGLWGFVGIDLVLSPSGPIIIEINPRLTTSYIGLKSVLNFNPTDLLMKYMQEKTPTRLAS